MSGFAGSGHDDDRVWIVSAPTRDGAGRWMVAKPTVDEAEQERRFAVGAGWKDVTVTVFVPEDREVACDCGEAQMKFGEHTEGCALLTKGAAK